MTTQIKCPHCNKLFEPTDAYKHEMEETLIKEVELRHKEEIRKLIEQQEQLVDKQKEETEELKRKIGEEARKNAIEKVRKEYDSKIQSTKEEAEENAKRNKELQEQTKDLLKQTRELKDSKDKIEIEYEKKLLEEQDKIKQSAKKEAQDELGLRIAEKEKKLNDAEKQILELQRKLQQGSQQLQGEVQELELEKLLAEEFPFDEINEVPKGIHGADALQVVRTQSGVVCGTIIWESKRTKVWKAEWIQKLKDDQRAVKADVAALVTSVMPSGIRTFGMVDSVLVCDLSSAMSIAYLLRQQLLNVHSAHVANHDKATKAEVVYNYLISNEFKQRIEVWVEYFRDRRDQIDKERMYFTKKWEKEEKDVLKIRNSTSGIYGDLQGLIGDAMPKVSSFELPEADEEDGNA